MSRWDITVNEEKNSTLSVATLEQLPDGSYFKEVEINDCPNRSILTKSTTHEEIAAETGATIIARGRFYDKSDVREVGGERALYLHISSHEENKLRAALKIVEKMFNTKVEYQDKIFLNIKDPVKYINLSDKIIGPNGNYLNFITQKCMCRVQLLGQEGEDGLYLLFTTTSNEILEKAKALGESLLNKIKKDYLKLIEEHGEKFSEQHNKQFNKYYEEGIYEFNSDDSDFVPENELPAPGSELNDTLLDRALDKKKKFKKKLGKENILKEQNNVIIQNDNVEDEQMDLD